MRDLVQRIQLSADKPFVSTHHHVVSTASKPSSIKGLKYVSAGVLTTLQKSYCSR